jgi:hypothetical protein
MAKKEPRKIEIKETSQLGGQLQRPAQAGVSLPWETFLKTLLSSGLSKMGLC